MRSIVTQLLAGLTLIVAVALAGCDTAKGRPLTTADGQDHDTTVRLTADRDAGKYVVFYSRTVLSSGTKVCVPRLAVVGSDVFRVPDYCDWSLPDDHDAIRDGVVHWLPAGWSLWDRNEQVAPPEVLKDVRRAAAWPLGGTRSCYFESQSLSGVWFVGFEQ